MAPVDEPQSVLEDTDPAAWAGLMAAAQNGDQNAYGRLLRAILPTLRALVGRALVGRAMVGRAMVGRAMVGRGLRDRADVEDTVQDILLTVHEARSSFDPARPFRPWLFGIARYRIIDRMRIQGRTTANETPIDGQPETFSSVAPNQDGMSIDSHALHAALAHLPSGQRMAIEELKLREQSLQAVSARTGVSIAALKVATHRGMKRLHALLVTKDSA